jgi:carboxylesterase
MAQHPWLDPSPFFFAGGPVGVLLIHGLTGAPTEMRPMGEYLAAQGYTVAGPRLCGHGTAWQELSRTRWQDWINSAGVALTQLQGRCRRIFVGGLSLGGLITLYLGQQHPEIAGLVPMAPALNVASPFIRLTPIAKRFVTKLDKTGAMDNGHVDSETCNRLWCYPVTPLAAAHEVLKLQRVIRPALGRIVQPLLIFQGRHDRAVRLDSAAIVYERAASSDKELVWLDNSGHCVTVDSEREVVWRKTHWWIQERLDEERHYCTRSSTLPSCQSPSRL